MHEELVQTMLGLLSGLKPGYWTVRPCSGPFSPMDKSECYLQSRVSEESCRMYLVMNCSCHWRKMSKSGSSRCWWMQTPEKAMLLMAWIKGIGQSMTGSLECQQQPGREVTAANSTYCDGQLFS